MSSSENWEYINRKSLIVSLAVPERALTPGQYAVFYKGEECLGSARMLKIVSFYYLSRLTTLYIIIFSRAHLYIQ